MGKFKDLTGERFNMLLVESLHSRGAEGVKWVCVCDCGNKVVQTTGKLSSGNTKSCGCLRSKTTTERNTTHGLSHLVEYSVWKDMKKRCYNENNNRYVNYSEKGVIVSDEFLNDFEAWFAHVGERPKDGQRWSIGRIDNTKNYERGNMVWQLDGEQAKAHSRQCNNKTGVTGVKYRTKIIKGVTYTSYTATINVEGKRYSKEFSCEKYGKDEAFRLACEQRKLFLDTYGVDFHDSHGK